MGNFQFLFILLTGARDLQVWWAFSPASRTPLPLGLEIRGVEMNTYFTMRQRPWQNSVAWMIISQICFKGLVPGGNIGRW